MTHVGGPVLIGVADAPALGERYHAARGAGAWCNGRAIEVSAIDRLDESFVLHAALEEFGRPAGTGVDALHRVVGGARASRGIGDGWAHLLVARGAAEALVEQGPCFEWDWAATSVIVEEAGGLRSPGWRADHPSMAAISWSPTARSTLRCVQRWTIASAPTQGGVS